LGSFYIHQNHEVPEDPRYLEYREFLVDQGRPVSLGNQGYPDLDRAVIRFGASRSSLWLVPDPMGLYSFGCCVVGNVGLWGMRMLDCRDVLERDIFLCEDKSYLFSIYINIEIHIENNLIISIVYPIFFVFYIFYIKNFICY
jgi:hypothetical protein